MPRTTNDKLFLGKEFISKLSATDDCYSFHSGVKKCNCLKVDDIKEVKKFFYQEIKDFWNIPVHWKHRTDAKAIGQFFGVYIYERSTLTSKVSPYVYHIGGKDMHFCLSTLIKIYGLNQDAMTTALSLLIDRKEIGLNLLKKACSEDMKTNQKLYWVFRNWFGHQIVPMSPKNLSARSILKQLGGFMLELNVGSMSAIDYINEHHCPKFKDLQSVTNGGDNIRYGSPGNNLPSWGSFDSKRQLMPFMNQVRPALFDHWENKKEIVFNYETDFIYSKLGTKRDNVPQMAHQDHDSDVIDKELDTLKISSMIGFTPISEDGMMILVWTEGQHKKYRSQEMIEKDEDRVTKDLDVAPGQYFIYIPRGVFVALPASTIHAGGFCFGKKEPLPVPPSNARGKAKATTSKTSPDVLLQNHRLHFSFLCSQNAFDAVQKETQITLIDAEDENNLKDYVPDEDIMKVLFECLLDCHPAFTPAQDSKKNAKSEEKVPKSHVRTLAKK